MRVTPLDRRGLASGVAFLCAADTDLAAIVRRHGPPPLWARRPGFATLVRIVLEQQVSLASALATYRRIQTGAGRVTPSAVAAIGADGLRRLGVTRQKAAYCDGIAREILCGRLCLSRIGRLEDPEARSALVAVRGVGPWTADVYLLMALGRPDVWPMGDLALLRALKRLERLRRLPAPEQAAALARRWTPWRSVAARILWHGYLSGW
jgi:DNA-3-methyladenine glycosylase II